MSRVAMMVGIVPLLLLMTGSSKADEFSRQTFIEADLQGTTENLASEEPSHGFEIRLPICSLISSPPSTDCLGCQLGQDGEPVGLYFLKTGRANVLWAEDMGLYGVNNRVCFRRTKAIPTNPNPSIILGAQVTNGFTPEGQRTTVEDKKAGVTIARIRGFVNNIQDSLVRGTVLIMGGTPFTLALQLYDDGQWSTVAEQNYPASTNFQLLEIETMVPGNSFVRFEVRMFEAHGNLRASVIQDARLFGTECYADANNPGMCL